jgi:hypothetical protein
MQRAPLRIQSTQTKKSKTPLIIAVVLLVMLIASALINSELNAKLTTLEEEQQALIYNQETIIEENSATVTTILEQFAAFTTYNQTATLPDDYAVEDITEIVENTLELYTYTNGTHIMQRYYFPTINTYTNPFMVD